VDVVVPQSDPLVGYFAWALDVLGDLHDVRDGLHDGSARDEEVLTRIDEVVRDKHAPRFSISIVGTDVEPPEPTDPTIYAVADYSALLAAFIGGIRADPWSLRWLGRFLARAELNQAVTTVGYLRALAPQQVSSPGGIPSFEQVREWASALGGGLPVEDQARSVISRYRRLSLRTEFNQF
jgi:hypothetical protein